MRKTSLPVIPEMVQRRALGAVTAAQRSGNTRTVRPAGAERQFPLLCTLLGPKAVPECHPYVTLLVTAGPQSSSSQMKSPLTVSKSLTCQFPPAPREWLLRCIT